MKFQKQFFDEVGILEPTTFLNFGLRGSLRLKLAKVTLSLASIRPYSTSFSLMQFKISLIRKLCGDIPWRKFHSTFVRESERSHVMKLFVGA
jgi:hypothetical protein